MSRSKIEQLTVLIYNKERTPIGSGTLFVPNKSSVYAYIFTAAHVVYDENNLIFKIVVDEDEMEFSMSGGDELKCHQNYEPDSDVKVYDVAIIRVKRQGWMNDKPTLTLGIPKEGESFQGFGFPKKACENTLAFAMLPLKGVVETYLSTKSRFQLSLTNNLDQSDRDDELKGYSGSGIYEKEDSKNELVLVGVFSYGQGGMATQNITNAFDSTLILDICRTYGWDEPEENMQLPFTFEPYIEGAVSIIENDIVKKQITDSIDYIIEEKIAPCTLIKKKEDLYDIPQCTDENRIRCTECWIARLQLISILVTAGAKIDDFQNPKIDIDGELDVPIEFFCSEGVKGSSTLKEVIRSILTSGYVWDNKFRENAILVWASKGKQTHKSMNRTRFNNIISDFCNEPISKRRRYDTMYGDGRANNLSIIHIDKLMVAIDDEENSDVACNLKEVLSNVVK